MMCAKSGEWGGQKNVKIFVTSFMDDPKSYLRWVAKWLNVLKPWAKLPTNWRPSRPRWRRGGAAWPTELHLSTSGRRWPGWNKRLKFNLKFLWQWQRLHCLGKLIANEFLNNFNSCCCCCCAGDGNGRSRRGRWTFVAAGQDQGQVQHAAGHAESSHLKL